MYKKVIALANNNLEIVQELSTGNTFIALSNKKYQAWIAEGNTPEPAETDEETTEREQAETNAAAEEYLRATNKWVIRFLETGKVVPQGITDERAAKRLDVEWKS